MFSFLSKPKTNKQTKKVKISLKVAITHTKQKQSKTNKKNPLMSISLNKMNFYLCGTVDKVGFINIF